MTIVTERIDIIELENRLEDATQAVIDARDALYNSSTSHTLARRQLEQKVAAAIIDGTITGKNQTERDARALELFPKEHEAVSDFQADESIDRLTLSNAELRLQLLRDKLRLMEVVEGVSYRG